MRPNPWTALLVLAAIAGFAFAAVSTYDFVAHLDRQVHGIHCSFLPGIGAAESGNTGCHTTLMSPYSSVLRSSVWGGIPISLPAMSVFAFLAFWGLWLLLRDRQSDPNATGFALAAAALPTVASLVMGYVSIVELDAACKLCIGIYLSSATALIAALMLWLDARRTQQLRHGGEPVAFGVLVLAFGLGVLFVAAPLTTYALAAPDFGRYVGSCGQLSHAPDPQLLVALGPQDRAASMIEVLDPLCPSCRGFEKRFSEMEASQTVSRRALLFPLDNACNWMVGDAIHPGACAISEAMLCAGERAQDVMGWAFENQEAIMTAARADPKAAQRMAAERFPELGRCIGSAGARNKLNLALRYAVKNRLQVLTPQVFVQGLRLCDEDTDLGLDYALPRLVERARSQPVELKPPSAPQPAIALQPQPAPPRPAAATGGIAPAQPGSAIAAPTPVAPPPTAQPAGAETADASPPDPPPEPPNPSPVPPPTPPEPPPPAPQDPAADPAAPGEEPVP
jgi:uncharacterized membrane protein